MPELTPEALAKHRADCEAAMGTAVEMLAQPAPLAELSDDELEIGRDFLRGVLGPELERRQAVPGLKQLRTWLALQITHEQTRRGMIAEIETGELCRMGAL